MVLISDAIVLYLIIITVVKRPSYSAYCICWSLTISSSADNHSNRRILDSAWFNVPANTVYVIWETVFTGQKTQPTVSKYWRKIATKENPEKSKKNTKYTYIH